MLTGERGHGVGKDNAAFVVLLDGGADNARHANAIAAHFHHLLLAVAVQIGGAHRFWNIWCAAGTHGPLQCRDTAPARPGRPGWRRLPPHCAGRPLLVRRSRGPSSRRSGAHHLHCRRPPYRPWRPHAVGHHAAGKAHRAQRNRFGAKAASMADGAANVSGDLMPASFSALTSFSVWSRAPRATPVRPRRLPPPPP